MQAVVVQDHVASRGVAGSVGEGDLEGIA
eukprot:SAG22_NODE_8244_length_671_cov_1.094406_1_plen_28_part_10